MHQECYKTILNCYKNQQCVEQELRDHISDLGEKIIDMEQNYEIERFRENCQYDSQLLRLTTENATLQRKCKSCTICFDQVRLEKPKNENL